MKRITKLLFILLINLMVSQSNAQILGSLNFNGNDNYVEIEDSPLNTLNVGNFTFEAWVTGKESEQTNHPVILSNRGTNAFDGGILIFFHDEWGGSQHKMLCFQVGASNYLLVNNGTFDGNILDGNCHHIAISRDGSNLSFFIDGNEIGNRTIPLFSNVSHDEPLWIGKDQATNNTFNGLISQCRIWNVARTQSQINQTKDASLQGNETGLIAYWEMDNENGQDVTDKTGDFNGVLGSSGEMENQDPTWSEDGCVDGSVVSTDDSIESFFFQVSPNPTSGLISIEHQSTKNAILNVRSADGKLILVKDMNETMLDIDISDYPKGIYFLQIRSENHIISRKVVKL